MVNVERLLKNIRKKYKVNAVNGVVVKLPDKRTGIIIGAEGELLRIFFEETKTTESCDPTKIIYTDYVRLIIKK